MKCEEYRNAIAAEPSFNDDGGHVDACAACRTYRDEIRALDRRIAGALAIDTPPLDIPELPELAAGNVIPLHKRRVTLPAWFAVAATVAIAAVVGVRTLSTDIEYLSLADEVLAHTDHEPVAMRVSNQPVSDERLQRVVPDNVAELDHAAGIISYARTCVINGRKVAHLVLQGERGPVMILLMPEEKVAAAEDLSGEHVNGVILPVGDGSIAIVGERDEQLERIRDNVLSSVTWTT